MKETTLEDIVEENLKAYGAHCITVADGHVLTFSLKTLKQLVEAAEETGRAVIFVKRGPAI